MAAFLFFLVLVAIFAALALAAERWGEDSRPSVGDDHRRLA
jgi:hypothetical protein